MLPKQIRTLTGLTQERFAKRLGLSRYTVIKAEAGNMSDIVNAIYWSLGIATEYCPDEMIKWFNEVDK